jgi:NodT family efflux transporter outer membrane factor (OMF) lipoprotein
MIAYRLRTWTIALSVGLGTGCAVGPRYIPPRLDVPSAYKEQAVAGGESLQAAQPQDHVSRQGWWELFGDAQLSELQARLMRTNTTIAQAEATLRVARAIVRQNRAAYFPAVTGSASATRAHLGASGRGSASTVADTASTTPAGSASSEYSLGLGASWEPDLWGRIRQNVAAATASAQAAAGDLESARLSVSAELAADYFQLRSLDAELALFDQTIDAYQRAATLTRNQYDAGLVSRSDVEQANTQLASAQAQSIDVRLQRAQLEHAIAVLVGEPPTPVPGNLPSRVLERRPDVAAAERRVAVANAQIGVASAAFFPAVTLGASGGFQASHLQQWLSWPMGCGRSVPLSH